MSKTKTNQNLSPVKSAEAGVKTANNVAAGAQKTVAKLQAKQKANAFKIAELRADGAKIGTDLGAARAYLRDAKKDLATANKALTTAVREDAAAKKAAKANKPAKTEVAGKAKKSKVKAK